MFVAADEERDFEGADLPKAVATAEEIAVRAVGLGGIEDAKRDVVAISSANLI